MNYNEFKSQYIKDMKVRLCDLDASFSEHKVEKMQGSYDALVVGQNNDSLGINLNISHCFEAYEAGDTYESMLDESERIVKGFFAKKPSFDVESFGSYEKMKGNLITEIVPSRVDREFLSKVPHRRLLDLIIVYRFELDSIDGCRSTILITNEMLEGMGIDCEQLHRDAVSNSPKRRPAVIKDMAGLLEEMGMPRVYVQNPMYVATVPDRNNGASVLSYETFLEDAAKIVGGSFYLLPSSIHELILVTDSCKIKPAQMEEMVKTINATQLASDEILSDSVYYYDHLRQVFGIIATVPKSFFDAPIGVLH